MQAIQQKIHRSPRLYRLCREPIVVDLSFIRRPYLTEKISK